MSQAILFHESDLDVPATAIAGASKNTQDMRVDGVIATGNFAGGRSVQLEGSVDEGTTWVAIGPAIIAATVLEAATVPLLLLSWPLLRLDVTVAGTGAVPDIRLTGHKRNYG